MPRSHLERIWDGHVLYIENPDGTVIRRLRRERYWSWGLAAVSAMLFLSVVAKIGFEVHHARAQGKS